MNPSRRQVALTAALALAMFAARAAKADERVLADAPIRIVTSSDPAMFPESWRGEPISASGRALDEAEFARARDILTRAARKYPPEVLERQLSAVYVLAELEYSGVRTGGTNSRTVVYVTVGEPRLGYTDAQIEGVFHAEFSSILLRNHRRRFDAEAWRQINPPGFEYLGNGVEAVRQGRAGLALDPALHEAGFHKQYSQSTLENDFNAFAAVLFSGDATRWDTVDRYPKLARKLRLAVGLYEQIHPALTEAYFRSLIAR